MPRYCVGYGGKELFEVDAESKEHILEELDIRILKDYCDNCEEFIEQENINDKGAFGCPLCERTDCISYLEP